MTPDTVAAIHAHALADYPREACGLLVSAADGERYIACRNVAVGPGDQFELPAEDWAAAEDAGAVTAVVHSHPDQPARPSAADRVACEASGLPWHIVEVRGPAGGAGEMPAIGEIYTFGPEGWRAPLVGRPFYHGVLDCYGIVRDWYQRQRAIVLPDFHRPDRWWEGDAELYLDNFQAASFLPLADGAAMAPGDVILMQMRSQRVNHAGVYLGSEPLKEAPDLHPVANAMLHHLYGRLSERVIYGGHWSHCTRLIIRHKDLM